jgi:hypothetical protein
MKAEVKTKSVKAKGEVILATAEVLDPTEMRNRARVAYSDFRKSWVGFANALADIKKTISWKELDYDSFKDFCVHEFVDVKFSAISKLVAIVEDNWVPALEAKLKADPNALLPSYETCYQLTASQDKLPKAAVPKLRKAVVDGEMTTLDMRKKLKEYGGIKEHEKALPDVDATSEAKEKETDVVVKADTDRLAEMLLDRIAFVVEHLGSLCSITKGTKAIAALTNKLQEITDPINKFLDHVESGLEA